MMMETRFSSMEIADTNANDCKLRGVDWIPKPINPCEMATDAMLSLYTVFGQCFSRLRRVQFDEEHQKSLLSCHMTEEGDSMHAFPDDVTLELRRRVQQVEADAHRLPMFSKDVMTQRDTYRQYAPNRTRIQPSRWAKRRAEVSNHQANNLNNQKTCINPEENYNNSSNNKDEQPEFSVLLSDTERALDEILSKTKTIKATSPVHLEGEDVQRLSVDELLSLRPSSSTNKLSKAALSPEKTGVDNQLEEQNQDPIHNEKDAKELRQWLAEIDVSRASEYCAYAQDFEKQGFMALEDLAQLDEDYVEQAMSEVGIAKFAHRARIRKAILKLHERWSSDNQIDNCN